MDDTEPDLSADEIAALTQPDKTVGDILEKHGQDLNEKQRAFVVHYAASENATQAAKAAGYSERSAYSQGARLLNHAVIAKCYSKIRTARAMALGFTEKDLIQRRIAIVNDPRSTALSKHRSMAALERIWGLNKPEEINVNLHGDLAQRMAKARKRKGEEE